jgi:hypothetical protein
MLRSAAAFYRRKTTTDTRPENTTPHSQTPEKRPPARVAPSHTLKNLPQNRSGFACLRTSCVTPIPVSPARIAACRSLPQQFEGPRAQEAKRHRTAENQDPV